MSEHILLEAASRETRGKAHARRQRRLEDMIPGVVYGGKEDAAALSLSHKELLKATKKEVFFSQLVDLKVDGKVQKVVVKALQRHPYKPKILHIDFFRVNATEKLTMNVSIHFVGEEDCPGVKEGGVLSHVMNEVEIRCLPGNLPEYIEADVSGLALDDILHLSALKAPEGVEFVALTHEDAEDLTVATVHIPRVASESDEPKEAEEESTDVEEGTEGGENPEASDDGADNS